MSLSASGNIFFLLCAGVAARRPDRGQEVTSHVTVRRMSFAASDTNVFAVPSQPGENKEQLLRGAGDDVAYASANPVA